MLRVIRTSYMPRATFGELRLDDEVMCVTLEDPPTEGRGPIPPGTYRVVLTYSPHFQMLIPEILDVPNRTAIRIHAGNSSVDTSGCILVGRYRSGPDEVAESRSALGILLGRWPEWHSREIEIV